ncbi:MAG: alpha/beta fold hydrolase [Immundisolibacter sp.]|uniref:alpha/beta fold hydrolase n=1 Tax=Immundisolibacter sp. TaxID=1934948 RepID=UPI00356509FE
MSTSIVEKTIQSGALASHVLLAGDPKAPPAILLHGAGPGATAASNWTRCMPDLAKHYYVIAPDLTGFGQTELPAELPRHILGWIGARVEQLLGLMDTMGLERAHVVGNSMGGALTLHMLVQARERFDKVLLMGAIGAPHHWTYEMHRLLAFYDDPRIARYREMMHSFVHDPAAVPELENIVQTRFATATDPKIRAVQENMFAAMRDGMDQLIVPQIALSRLPHEVCIVHGRQDRIVPLETSLYFLQHLKNAELHVLDRCGHWAQTQRWDAMYPLIVKHFGG